MCFIFCSVLSNFSTINPLQVRTSGKKPPAVAVQGALTDLKEELSGLKFQFQQQAGMMQQ